jgi:cytochrome P460
MLVKAALSISGALLLITSLFDPHASHGARIGNAPVFTSDGKLKLPADYREWAYVSTGLGMSYRDNNVGRQPVFDNVFVQRDAYRDFIRTRVWPNRTMFILELRHASDHGSILKDGRFQSDVASVEASVKDASRFANTWAYFDFGAGRTEASPLPDAECFACHRQNGAVDNTFIQFYPTLLKAIAPAETRAPARR